MTVVLLFTALVTPFEISFLKQHINGERPHSLSSVKAVRVVCQDAW